MNWKRYVSNTIALLLAVTASASLAACSTGWAGVDSFTRAADPYPQGVKLASLNPIPPNLPNPPPALSNCFKHHLPPKDQVGSDQSADAKVKTVMQENEIKTVCGKNLLHWYHGVQEDNGVKSQEKPIAHMTP